MVAARFKEVGFAITNSFSDIVVRPYRGLVVVVVVGVVVALFLRIMVITTIIVFIFYLHPTQY
jgi:hypothetical protein